MRTDLEVIRTLLIILTQGLFKDDDRIPDEQMSKVGRQRLVHPPLDEMVPDLGVDRHVVVVVLWSVRRAIGDVAVHRIVPRLGNDEAIVLERLCTLEANQQGATH